MKIERLIVKFKRNVEDEETMIVYDEEGEYVFKYGNSVENILAFSLKTDARSASQIMNTDLSNFEEMIQQGYTIKLNKLKDHYVLIISKDGHSKYYTSNKEGLLNMLIEANYDYEFISELKEVETTLQF